MKKVLILIAITIVISFAYAQERTQLPDVKIKDLLGNTVSTSTFKNEGKPIVIGF